MKRILHSVLFILMFGIASGQNNPLFSSYMFNPGFYNPAFTGAGSSYFISQVRSQWVGYQSSFDGPGGAPNTQLFSASIPVIGKLSGVGIQLLNDRLGAVSNLIFQLPVSYTLPLANGKMTMGVMPGFQSVTQGFNELRFGDNRDPFNVGTRETQTKANVSAGLYYETATQMFLSISVMNIPEPQFNFGNKGLENNLTRSLYFISGARKKLSDSWLLRPYVNVKSDFTTFSFDVSTLFYYQQKSWFGLSYRWQEAAIVMLGYSLLPENKLQLGYALDIVTDQREAKQATSQEIFIRYNLPDLVLGGKKQIKTPRFTY
ncbi:MAG: PorP/SprF family type IX secretion system membrane protein [Cyclobacteriaceae bacterium]|nr:PorP/SprF family type IX secretion system membrane protein [Cyclobacteriaceae bacterium]